jgi:hypothetical protein
MSTNVNARELFLFATNDGQLYPKAVALARRKATKVAWFFFADEAADKYGREIRNSRYYFTTTDKKLAARKLRAYYVQHVKESGGDRRSRRPALRSYRSARKTSRRRRSRR